MAEMDIKGGNVRGRIEEKNERSISQEQETDRVGTGRALGRHGGKEEGIDTGQVDSQGEESGISRLAGVAMVTELGKDVIMPWLIQTWQAPITLPLERGVRRILPS